MSPRDVAGNLISCRRANDDQKTGARVRASGIERPHRMTVLSDHPRVRPLLSRTTRDLVQRCFVASTDSNSF
jgi:hypothetical protein